LGLVPGDTVRVLRRAAMGGPLLIECRGTQIALGRNIARQVIVG
jgi:Fe2+ transport system protein FeoA